MNRSASRCAGRNTNPYLRFRSWRLKRQQGDVSWGQRLRHLASPILKEDGRMEGTDDAIGQAIVFVNVPVSGYFRYRDQFLSAPVPATAPQPWHETARYPFILQFSYKSREDKLSDASLRNAHSNWWVKILNVLLSKKPNRWAQNQPPTVVGRMRIPWQPV